MPDPLATPKDDKPVKLVFLDRLTIQGIIALTICFAVIGLTLVCLFVKVPADGPVVGIIAGTISGLMTLLGIIVKHFYDSATRTPPMEK
jgi:uncharacterized membrane protein